jgi:hypothetical protein
MPSFFGLYIIVPRLLFVTRCGALGDSPVTLILERSTFSPNSFKSIETPYSNWLLVSLISINDCLFYLVQRSIVRNG